MQQPQVSKETRLQRCLVTTFRHCINCILFSHYYVGMAGYVGEFAALFLISPRDRRHKLVYHRYFSMLYVLSRVECVPDNGYFTAGGFGSSLAMLFGKWQRSHSTSHREAGCWMLYRSASGPLSGESAKMVRAGTHISRCITSR